MSGRPPLFVRVDATAETGLGHFMRCIAIAQRWHDDHGPVTFIGTFDAALLATLEREAFAVVQLPWMHPDPRNLATTLTTIEPDAAVVLDGYHFDYEYQQRIAERAQLLVIDDVGHLPRYAGAILLNASANANEIEYPDAPQRRLLGLRYAMLRREIFAARERVRLRRETEPVRRLLVGFGGADIANETLRVLRALCVLDVRPAEILAIPGPVNVHGHALQEFAAEHTEVSIVAQPVDMAGELADADFVIATASTISAELAFLGKPCILLAVADNQLGVGPAMEREGAAIYGGDIRTLGEQTLVETLRAGLADIDRRKAMRAAGPRLVDGLGSRRICRELSGVANV